MDDCPTNAGSLSLVNPWPTKTFYGDAPPTDGSAVLPAVLPRPARGVSPTAPPLSFSAAYTSLRPLLHTVIFEQLLYFEQMNKGFLSYE